MRAGLPRLFDGEERGERGGGEGERGEEGGERGGGEGERGEEEGERGEEEGKELTLTNC